MALSTETVSFVNTVAQALSAMSERDRSFCESVLYTVKAKGRMSERQQEVLQNAVTRATAPKTPVPTEKVGDMAGVIALFDRAKQKLQYPKITLQTISGDRVVISMAGASAKVPGSLNVTDGGSYGSNIWYGRVLRDGTWEQPRTERAGKGEVRHLLQDLAANPAEVATRYGRLTGNCCFCATKLDDERSIAVGYGPTCSKNYGLPWGKQAAAKANPLFAADAVEAEMHRMEAEADRAQTLREEANKHRARRAMAG